MRIKSIKIQNFKALQNVYLEDMPAFFVLVGANGTGKTTFFDVFSFLQDCITYDVSRALQARGGFGEVISRGVPKHAQICMEIKFRMDIAGRSRLVTYEVQIGGEKGKGVVQREVLCYKRGPYGSPFHFIAFSRGEGYAISNEEDFDKKDEELNREYQTTDSDKLAIKGLGQFSRFKAAKAFLELIEKWHISNFHISAARQSNDVAGLSEYLSTSGDNLKRVAFRIKENHPEIFENILEEMKKRVPGIAEITTSTTEDGRLLLKFADGAFTDAPFFDVYVSDGTLKMFAYLLLLHHPEKRPLLCVEEPENQLYHSLFAVLARELKHYSKDGLHVFVSTHSPDFLNAVGIDNVFWLQKKDGYTTIKRARDDPQIRAYMKDGDQMGYLWKQDFFEGVAP